MPINTRNSTKWQNNCCRLCVWVCSMRTNTLEVWRYAQIENNNMEIASSSSSTVCGPSLILTHAFICLHGIAFKKRLWIFIWPMVLKPRVFLFVVFRLATNFIGSNYCHFYISSSNSIMPRSFMWKLNLNPMKFVMIVIAMNQCRCCHSAQNLRLRNMSPASSKPIIIVNIAAEELSLYDLFVAFAFQSGMGILGRVYTCKLYFIWLTNFMTSVEEVPKWKQIYACWQTQYWTN